MKKYTYLIIGIIVVAAVAIFVIFWLKNKQLIGGNGAGQGAGSLPLTPTQIFGGGTPSSTGAASGTATGATTTAATFGIALNQPVIGYFVDKDNTIYAVSPDGTVIESSQGTVTTVSSTTIPDVISASFSFDGKKVLLQSGDPNAPKADIYDLSSKTWVSAPSNMISPQWSSSDYEIAYLSAGKSARLSLSLIDASNLKKGPVSVFSMAANDLSLQWPSKNLFILSDKPTDQAAGSVWALNASSQTLTPIIYEAQGAESAWGNTASGTLGLLFSANNGTPSLKLVTPAGTTAHVLNILTLPSKCTFAMGTAPLSAASSTASSTATSTAPSKPSLASYLYCGVPSDPSSLSSAIPDTYNMMGAFTLDNIMRVNVQDGSKETLLSTVAGAIDVANMKIVNGTIFFISRYDQKLYALLIPQE